MALRHMVIGGGGGELAVCQCYSRWLHVTGFLCLLGLFARMDLWLLVLCVLRLLANRG